MVAKASSSVVVLALANAKQIDANVSEHKYNVIADVMPVNRVRIKYRF